MDPLSISASVAGLTASCVQTAKALRDLKDKFDNANLTISAICTETTLISASMSHIQSHILKNPDSVLDKLQSQPSLESTLDQALTGCYVVFDLLQGEIAKLTESDVLETSVTLGFAAKVRYMWSESTMKELLSQIRGLQVAFTFLLQLLGVDTITELKQIMDQNTAILAEVAQHTSRISTSAKKASHAPRSIYDMSFKTLSISEDNASLYSSKLFTFDDEVVNSTAYRQVLAKAYARGGSPAPEDTKEATAGQERDSKSRNEERDSVSETSTMIGSGSNQESRTGATIASSAGHDFSVSMSDDPLKEFLQGPGGFSDWPHHWSLKREDLASVSKKEIERQNLLHEIIFSEQAFIKQLQVIHYLYYHRLILHPSKTVSDKSNQEFAEKNFSFHQRFYRLHKEFLCKPLLKRQTEEGPWISSISDIVQKWLIEATPIYLEFSSLYPHINFAVELEATRDARFAIFLSQSREHKSSNRLTWSTFLMAPLTRIQRYPVLLTVGLKTSDPENPQHQYNAMEQVIQDIRDLGKKCNSELSRADKKVQLDRLSAQVGPTLADFITNYNSEILFDQELSHQKGSLRGASQVRFVILGSTPHASILILSRVSKLKRVGDETNTYELVTQFITGPPAELLVSSNNIGNGQTSLTLSQNGTEPSFTFTTSSIKTAKELLKILENVGAVLKQLPAASMVSLR